MFNAGRRFRGIVIGEDAPGLFIEVVILAAADGVVKKVFVSQGQNVAHGAVLVEFE